MKRMLATVALALPFGLAYAQSHTAEAAPQMNSKSQAAAEAKKASRKSGVAPINDGSTAEGQGSGLDTVTSPERVAMQRQAQREALPHQETTQGATPK